ncbi:MAG: NAD+ synthase [Bdellovibrionaceae bacterium]|nr:NAD+ synthase [Pseudobdellovibrionaceae bacterium]
MKFALAQINATLGDFSGNREIILEYIRKAHHRGCDIVIFPEAALFGYHPVDLLERPSVVEQELKELKKLEKLLPPNILVILGAITLNPNKSGKPYCNSAVVLQKNKKTKICAKELLPTYDVFDEGRHIEPGSLKDNIIVYKGKKILITVCEDIWAWPNPYHGKRSPYLKNPITKLKPKDVDFVVNLSASPFTINKVNSRKKVCKKTALFLKSPVIYVNMVGAQDEIIFDGGSFVTSSLGKIVAKAHQFIEDILVFDSDLNRGFIQHEEKNKWENYRLALVLGIRDFLRKTGFTKAHLGLSGGIDSALVACLLADALGPQNVSCILLPGPYTSQQSEDLANKLVSNLGVQKFEYSILNHYEQINNDFSKTFDVKEESFLQENFQARLRCLILMGFSNFKNSLLINTSNKSEFSVGYSTLYGDMAGAICPIGDLTKTEVYGLSEWYNREYELIPRAIIEREPSAELRANQKDSDHLPEYNLLDPVVKKIVEQFKTANSKLEKNVLNKMMKSEFKRWQSPPILKVSNHAFGRGRRLPIAHKAFY